jgi:hypothetical protein
MSQMLVELLVRNFSQVAVLAIKLVHLFDNFGSGELCYCFTDAVADEVRLKLQGKFGL